VPVPFEGADPQGDYYNSAGYLAVDIAAPGETYKPIDKSPGYAGRGVNVFTEEQRRLIYQDVAQHSAERACYHTHHNRYPHRIARSEGLLYADYHEQGQAEGVEDKQHTVVADQHFPEYDDDCKRQAGDTEIPECLHPEHRYIEQQVAERTSADGCHQPDGVGSEPIEVAECGQADA